MIFLFALVLGVPTLHQTIPTPHNLRDSTMQVVADVGSKVADVRGRLDRYRMLVFNDTNATGAMLQWGGLMRGACSALVQAATTGRRIMCPNCLTATMQPAFNRYRAYLPTLAGAARRCTAQLDQRRLERASPAETRQLVLDLSGPLVSALTVYEGRLTDVMQALQAHGARPRAGPGRP